MNINNKVLVVGCYVSGLGTIRALAGKNIHIVALYYEKTHFAQTSKYVSEIVHVPHPRLEEEKFIDLLISNSERWKGALIIETDDEGVVSISKNKSILEKFYKIATPPWEILRQFIEKKEAFLLSQKCDVPHPTTFLPASMEDIEKVKNEITYPCILKPVRGHEFFSKFRIKNFEVPNETELISQFKLCLEADQEVMLQEIIIGPDTNLYKLQAYINSKGEMSAKFFFNKLRQHPPMFGVGRVGISTKRNEEVEILAERLMRKANYKGFFSIEFKKDPKDNQLKLMEVNVRMPRNNMLATTSGVNFPWVIYSDLIENKQIDIDDYKKNCYWIELYIDILNILFKHKKENFTLLEYIRPYISKGKVFAVFSLKDFSPFLKLTQIYLTGMYHK